MIINRLSTLLLYSIMAAHCCLGQEAPIPQADSANLMGLTTPITVSFSDGRVVNGSGFFYFEYGPDDSKAQGPHWRAIARIYVVTAKHLIQPTRLRDLTTFTFAIRVGKQDHVDWHRLELSGAELGKRLHVCQKDTVDVAVVEVTDLENQEIKKLLEERIQVMNISGATLDQLPNKSPLEVQPGDDVIVIGYPMGLYDQFNKLPVLKKGMLSTPVGLHFDGLDAFLLDFKYYEGSSGSLIISKPTHVGLGKNNEQLWSTNRQYVFLGVYEGETYLNGDQAQLADLGLGWYSYNIEEAIKNQPVVH